MYRIQSHQKLDQYFQRNFCNHNPNIESIHNNTEMEAVNIIKRREKEPEDLLT